MDKRTRLLAKKLCAQVGVEFPTTVFRISGKQLALVVNDDNDVVSSTWRHPSDGGKREFPVGLYVVCTTAGRELMVGTNYPPSDETFEREELEILKDQGFLKIFTFE